MYVVQRTDDSQAWSALTDIWKIWGEITLIANDKVRIKSEQAAKKKKNFFSQQILLQSLGSAQGRVCPALTQTHPVFCNLHIRGVRALSAPSPLPNKTCNTHVPDSFKPRKPERNRGRAGKKRVSVEMQRNVGATSSLRWEGFHKAPVVLGVGVGVGGVRGCLFGAVLLHWGRMTRFGGIFSKGSC